MGSPTMRGTDADMVFEGEQVERFIASDRS